MTSVSNRLSVIAAICISFIAMAPFLVLPLFIAAIASDKDLSNAQLGLLASCIMAGSAISSVLAIFWVRKVNWRLAAFFALTLAFVALILAIFINNITVFYLLLFLAGFGGGSAYSLVLTVLSDYSNAERYFGFSLAAQVSFQVVGLLFLPQIIETGGLSTVLGILGGMALVGSLLSVWLPQNEGSNQAANLQMLIPNTNTLLSLLACLMFFFNVGVVWTFIERMADANGFASDFIGLALSVGVSLGIAGALLASWCGDRFGYIRPLALGALLTVASLLLLVDGMSKAGFIIALGLYNFGWNFSLAFQYAAVNKVDNTGSAVAAAPAFHAVGAAIGPAVAALFVTNYGFAAVNVLAGASTIMSLVLFTLAIRWFEKKPVLIWRGSH